jgi:hypothetical protein
MHFGRGVTPCREGGICPRVFLESTGHVVSQGYDHDSHGLATPPAGERQHEMELSTWRRLNEQVERMAGYADDPWRSVTRSAFRLEVRQHYEMDSERKEFEAFLLGEPVASLAGSPWFRRVAETTKAGVRWARVFVCSWPLSDYRRYELEGAKDNLACGEDVRIVTLRDDDPLWDDLGGEDFWLLDADSDVGSVVILDFGAEGQPRGWRWTPDPGTVIECMRRRDLALQVSTPVPEFLQAAASSW